jgi:2-haloalkanoic acid dehalogenase type II
VLAFQKFEALAFDCYGTLIDWESGLLPILERWAGRNRVPARGDALLEAFARTETYAEAENPSALYPDILRIVVRLLAKQFAVTADPASEDELAESIGEWPPFPDTTEALLSLKQHYKLAILSNVDRRSFEQSNRRLGVEFDLIVTAQDVGSYKPNLANFHALLGRLAEMGITKEKVLHVAQSLYHDHVPARQLGLHSVWINRRRAKRGHGATVPAAVNVTPDAEYGSMQEFAAAAVKAFNPA